MQDSNCSENGNGNPNGDGHGNSLLEGEIIEVCGVQRGNEPYPCTNAEPCDLHCGAKTRGERGGRKCSNYAMPNGRCRMHSGHANRGIGHPRFRDGRDSRYTPKGIKDAYERALVEGIRTTENREEPGERLHPPHAPRWQEPTWRKRTFLKLTWRERTSELPT